MLPLSHEQLALLRLPDPFGFLPKLAVEIRRDHPREVSSQSDQQLLSETQRSYEHAAYELKLTHLPTLVRWVKADVAWARGLRSNTTVDLWIRNADNRNLTAADILSNLAGR